MSMLMITRQKVKKQLTETDGGGLVVGKKKPLKSRSVAVVEAGDIEEAGAGSSKKEWSPPFWRNQLDNIRTMRKSADAPVDTMGCNACADPSAPPKVKRFQALVALMLSSQTKDEVTFAAMGRLKKHGCTPQNIVSISDEELGRLLTPVGFWKKKVVYLKKTAEILQRDFDGDIPDSVEGLCALPGVGPKMGHLAMQIAWGKCSGIGVDTHVHRIANRLGWCQKEAASPEQTRKALEAWLPKDLWIETNKLLVGFGQQICQPVKPKCSDCLNQNICPYAVQNAPSDS